MAETIYIVDPLPEERRRIVDALTEEPVIVVSYDDAVQFLDQVSPTASGCVLVPIDLPGMGLRALMDEIKRRHLPLAVVVLGRNSEFATAVECHSGRIHVRRLCRYRPGT
jgi:FixJ family two-component response regulator